MPRRNIAGIATSHYPLGCWSRRRFRIVVWHSIRNQLYLQNIIAANSLLLKEQNNQRLQLRLFSPDSTQSNRLYGGAFWYSRLLTSTSFWKSIDTPLALIMQSDTLICKPPPSPVVELIGNISPFLGGISGFTKEFAITSGGPAGQDAATQLKIPMNPRHNIPATSFLNGGFSLHDVSWSIHCIEPYANLKKKGWVEDDLFNYCQIMQNSSTAPVTEVQAYSFASDNGKTQCFDLDGKRVCPFAVHKPWQNKKKGYNELVASCPELEQLERLQFVHQGRYCNTTTTTTGASRSMFECNCTRPRLVRTVSRAG